MNRPRAFTLIEVLVSLAAGGLVLVALLVLSKNATAAFNEEVRLGALAASVRSATQRLQGDLLLASYLSTPNFRADPMIARTRNAASNGGLGTLAGARRLAGVRLVAGGSDLRAPRNVANGYRNDLLEVSGNLSGSDPFVVLDVLIGGGGGCDRVILNMDTPAIWRLRDATAADPNAAVIARLQQLFVPATREGDAAQHLVRFVDPQGREQFLSTCRGRASIVAVPTVPAAVAIDVTAGVGNRILTTADTGGVGGWPGRAVGGCTINPVHVVRYEVGTSAALAPGLVGLEASTEANPKYDLYRTYLDAAGAPIAGPELVAEYVAGLRFGLTVDSATLGAPGTVSALTRVSEADVAGLANWASEVDGTLARPDPASGSIGPHRIRAVHMEITARVPLADRDRPEPAASVVRRYCIPGGCVPGSLTYARTRTTTMDVALANQSGVFF
jgi:prepilin-type N-terminal cleavage/methylation domain-containing protein